MPLPLCRLPLLAPSPLLPLSARAQFCCLQTRLRTHICAHHIQSPLRQLHLKTPPLVHSRRCLRPIVASDVVANKKSRIPRRTSFLHPSGAVVNTRTAPWHFRPFPLCQGSSAPPPLNLSTPTYSWRMNKPRLGPPLFASVALPRDQKTHRPPAPEGQRGSMRYALLALPSPIQNMAGSIIFSAPPWKAINDLNLHYHLSPVFIRRIISASGQILLFKLYLSWIFCSIGSVHITLLVVFHTCYPSSSAGMSFRKPVEWALLCSHRLTSETPLLMSPTSLLFGFNPLSTVAEVCQGRLVMLSWRGLSIHNSSHAWCSELPTVKGSFNGAGHSVDLQTNEQFSCS